MIKILEIRNDEKIPLPNNPKLILKVGDKYVDSSYFRALVAEGAIVVEYIGEGYSDENVSNEGASGEVVSGDVVEDKKKDKKKDKKGDVNMENDFSLGGDYGGN